MQMLKNESGIWFFSDLGFGFWGGCADALKNPNGFTFYIFFFLLPVHFPFAFREEEGWVCEWILFVNCLKESAV